MGKLLKFLVLALPLLIQASPKLLQTIDKKGLLSTPLVNARIQDFLTASEAGIGGGADKTGRALRVCYQGVPGAYSDASTKELLGQNVVAIGRPSFEDCFQAVASMECDYACLPVENSLGGSIHENYDLMLRYDLTIVAEHEFRVKHCLLAKEGVKREDIKYAISHPQALAQCDNFLRGLGITPIPTYDTAGSAKMIADGGQLPDKCTPENTAAIASALAGKIYGMNCLNEGIEDDDTNFTRFLLLGRQGVGAYITKNIPAKTSVVFTLPNTAGALYKALACFSLRDIDFSKIESRPTSASLLNFLKFKSQQLGRKARNKADLPRFRYCFYLDFLANELDENTQNALAHLREQADFMRILGSFPRKSRLVGPVKEAADRMKHMALDMKKNPELFSLSSDQEEQQSLRIGIVGFGSLGQSLAKRMVAKHHVVCLDKEDRVSFLTGRKHACIFLLANVSFSELVERSSEVRGGLLSEL
jgi:prephenate dehydratase